MRDLKFVIILVAIGLIASFGYVVGQDSETPAEEAEEPSALLKEMGYWEKQTDDPKYRVLPQSDTFQSNIKSGEADVKILSADGKDHYRASFGWTVPNKIYAPQEKVKLTISVSFDEYTYTGQIQSAGAHINVAFLPNLVLVDKYGEKGKERWRAEVSGHNGVKTKPEDTLFVERAFPAGSKNKGDEKLTVSCTAGEATYIYKWIDPTDIKSEAKADHKEKDLPEPDSESTPPIGRTTLVTAYTTDRGAMGFPMGFESIDWETEEQMEKNISAGKHKRAEYRNEVVPAFKVRALREKYGWGEYSEENIKKRKYPAWELLKLFGF